MFYIVIIEKVQGLIRGLIDKHNTYSAKRWTAMWITFVMLVLTVFDFIYNNCVLRDWILYTWAGILTGLFGQTLLDKRMDKRAEVEMVKANKDLDLNVKMETKETKNENK